MLNRIPTEHDIRDMYDHLAIRQHVKNENKSHDQEEVEEMKRIYFFLNSIRSEESDSIPSTSENSMCFQ